MSFEGQKLVALFKMSFKSGRISLSETVCLCTENCLLGVLMFELYLNFQSEGTTNHQYLLPQCFFLYCCSDLQTSFTEGCALHEEI